MNTENLFAIESAIDNFVAWMIVRTDNDKVLCRSSGTIWFEDFFDADPRKIVLFWIRDKENLCNWLETELKICKETDEITIDTLKNRKFEFIEVKVINQKIIL